MGEAFNARRSESGLHVLVVVALLLLLSSREIRSDFCGGIMGVVPFRSFFSLFSVPGLFFQCSAGLVRSSLVMITSPPAPPRSNIVHAASVPQDIS